MGRFFMWYVYVLLSKSSGRTYVGFTNDVVRRLFEHNVSETSGFTLRYRPWTLVVTEAFPTKAEAMSREKFLKTGRGREDLRKIISQLPPEGAVSAAAEKD